MSLPIALQSVTILALTKCDVSAYHSAIPHHPGPEEV